jgi:Ion transport protein
LLQGKYPLYDVLYHLFVFFKLYIYFFGFTDTHCFVLFCFDSFAFYFNVCIKKNRIFGVPIGVLGAGFEQIVGDENKDNTEELQRCTSDTITSEEGENTTSPEVTTTTTTTDNDSDDDRPYDIEIFFYNFANGIGSVAAQQFELLIYFFIFIAVAVGCYQTIDGQSNAFNDIEILAILIFTIEYIFRLIGTPADPLFTKKRTNSIATGIRSIVPWSILCRIKFICSFYSVIDLLAIIPFYLSLALPNSFVNDYDEYLRMLRIIRLVKLDKYVPSITLVGKLLLVVVVVFFCPTCVRNVINFT